MKNSPDDQEFIYIQACLGHQLFPDQDLPIPPADLDWERLFTLLESNRLAAFFYGLRSIHGSDWPVEFCKQIRQSYYKFSLHNEQSAGLITQLLSTLRNSEVDVIVLKGWAFIQTIYAGDRGVRFCVDLDILVRPQDSAKAAGLLMELGYQPWGEFWPGYGERYIGVQIYFPQDKQLPLQIGFHLGLLHVPSYDPNLVDINGLFTRARPLKVEGVDVLELSSEDQIVYGCAHLGLHHRYDDSLYFYYEIGALIRRAGLELDWEAMIQRALEWHYVIPLQRVLVSVEHLWPGMVPPAVLEKITLLSPTPKERFVNWWIVKTRGRSSLDYLLAWITTHGLKRRAGFAFQNIFPSREYMRKRYGPAPAGLWPLFYFLRLFHSFRQMKKSP